MLCQSLKQSDPSPSLLGKVLVCLHILSSTKLFLASCCLAYTPDSKCNAFWPDEMGDVEWCCVGAVEQEGHCLQEAVVVVVDEEHSLLRLGVLLFFDCNICQSALQLV